jgi:hypothetical protein
MQAARYLTMAISNGARKRMCIESNVVSIESDKLWLMWTEGVIRHGMTETFFKAVTCVSGNTSHVVSFESPGFPLK